MKNKILNLEIIVMLFIMLFVLTGCTEKNDINNVNNNKVYNVSNKKNNNNIQQNKIKNEINISKNESKRNEIQQTNQISKNNTIENKVQSLSKNEIEKPYKETKFNVGDYVLHYGNYVGSGTKLIDTSIVHATITINLKDDGTYTYVSTNQEVSKDRSGTYTIKDKNIIVLNDSEPLEYSILSDDHFIERQGSGFMFNYKED